MLRWMAAAVILSGGLAFGQVAPEQDRPVGVGPEPSPTPVSWEIDFKYVPPRQIAVKTKGSDRPQVYWYMLYTAINTSNTTQHFYPTFELVTDDLKVIETDMGISPLVFDAIRERHKITHKYLVSPSKAIGDLNVGQDYARESVAIWRADNITTNKFKIYVSGLSGETRAMPNPNYDPDKPGTTTVELKDGRTGKVVVNPEYFPLRKTLELSYTLPVSTPSQAQIDPRLDSARWIMR